jgi:hypothetical protein
MCVLLQRCQKDTFTNDQRALSRFFFNASRNRDTADLLRDVVFDDTSGYPRSAELDVAILRLQTTGAIGRDNPAYARNSINIRDATMKKAGTMTPTETAQLAVLEARFEDELCA